MTPEIEAMQTCLRRAQMLKHDRLRPKARYSILTPFQNATTPTISFAAPWVSGNTRLPFYFLAFHYEVVIIRDPFRATCGRMGAAPNKLLVNWIRGKYAFPSSGCRLS